MRLYQHLTVLILVLVTLSASGMAGLAASHPSTAADNTTYLPVISRPGPTPFFAIEAYPNQIGGSTAVRNQAIALGASWLRLNSIRWDRIQPVEGGPYDWSVLAAFERDLNGARAAGLTPSIIIHAAPTWATGVGSNCAPIMDEKLPAFAAFVEALVTRYRDQVRFWELGNEPDIDWRLVPPDSIFGCWGNADDPYYGGERYGRMLQAVAPAIRRADPTARIIIGGLLMDRPNNNNTPGATDTPWRFFEGVLRSGAANSFDIVAFHSYLSYQGTFPFDHDRLAGTAWSDPSIGGSTIGKSAFLRNVMQQFGIDKPIWLNEMGLLCTGCTEPPPNAFFAAQADHLIRVMARSGGSNLGMVAWYPINGPGWRNSGLLDASQRPRPVFIAYQHLIRLAKGYDRVQSFDYGQPAAIEGYRFVKVTGLVDVLWSRSTTVQTVALPADKFVRATGIDSNALPADRVQTVGNEVRVTVGYDPIFIERRP
ncbi:cellulase family glycosylhydrolase [Candidatus Chloroploca asiatica]|uniref:cellulase family glycosylhydrolase n=1 Tax=Candidatus Chloroploca asiatica TaxID=1506545 RepID=UPI0015589380|nr:cellulase family glycosylhydrolase [Candidatus Chloroploca asiatica]